MLTRDTIYVKVYVDRFVLKNVDSSAVVEVRRDPKYRSLRMLVGNFTVAEKEFREGLKKIRRGFLPPRVLVHPMELIQGGVTQVESRTFVELAAGSGAHKVGVWEGAELSADEVRKAISSFKDA